MNKITLPQIQELGVEFGIDWKLLDAFIEVEGSGSGFNPDGKLKIQFEPLYFYRHTKLKIDNKVEVQSKEWAAFNQAFKLNPGAAMMSTSIGILQTMGEEYLKCGYTTVNDMWDDYKKGEYQQVRGGCQFIKNKKPLYAAMKNKQFDRIAYYYNGPKYYMHQYDVKLKNAYEK